MPAKEKPIATFVGDPSGAYHHGIPARDLDAADWAALTDADKDLVAASPLYELHEPKAQAEPEKPRARPKSAKRAARSATKVAVGETATVTGDGSGEALPPLDATTERAAPAVTADPEGEPTSAP